VHQARLANARLAAEQYHLPQPLGTLCPTLAQQRHLCLAAHQGREPGGLGHVQAALCRAFPEDLVHWNRLRHPLQRGGPQILARKKSCDEAIGGGTDQHRIGCCEPLDTRRHVGRFAQGQLFLSAPTAHLAHHHQAGMNAKAHR